ncbi:hypothetical protein pb186bvf_003624 [Paramecium bursaria]
MLYTIKKSYVVTMQINKYVIQIIIQFLKADFSLDYSQNNH